MTRFSPRKVAAVGLGTALIGSALTVGLGTGVASAADRPVSECGLSNSETSKWAGSFGTPYTLSKEIVGDGTAAAGRNVTYLTKVAGSGATVSQMRDFHPAGFQLVSARVKDVIGEGWTDVTKTVSRGDNAVIAKVIRTTAANVATLETTYKVPASAQVGQQLNSGAGTMIDLASGDWNITPFGVCVTIRPANPVEAGTGSLEDAGFGSINAGSSQVFGSATDPQGSLSNVIGGIFRTAFGS